MNTTNRQASGPMGDFNGDENVSVDEVPLPRVDKLKKVSFIPLFLNI